jgi:Fe-S-cluster containining protein
MKRLLKSKIAIINLEPEDHKKKRKPKRKETVQHTSLEDFEKIEMLDEGLIIKKEWLPVSENTRWKCQKCGWCCTQNWRINLTWKEYDRLNDKLTINQIVVNENTGMSHPVYSIKNRCEQHDAKTKKCKIYTNRLYSCAAFPFNLDEDGALIMSKHCKGIGHGDKIDMTKMKTYLRKWRKKAGMKKI